MSFANSALERKKARGGAKTVGDCRGHFDQAAEGLVGNDLLLFRGQQNRRASGKPINPEIDKQTDHCRQPDHPVAAIEAFNQVKRLPVNFSPIAGLIP